METPVGAPSHVVHRLRQETKTGACVTVQPSTVNGSELGAQECQDTLFMIFGIELLDHPKFCDRCNAAFSICHLLDCKKGVLVMAHHNKLRYVVADLAGKDFTPTHVREDPLIFAGFSVQRKKSQPAGSTHPPPKNNSEVPEHKGNLLILKLCQNGTDSVQYMHVVNTYDKSH